MPQLAIDIIEMGVGAACLAAAAGTWRRGMRVAAGALAVLGAAAVIHAAWSIATR